MENKGMSDLDKQMQELGLLEQEVMGKYIIFPLLFVIINLLYLN